MRDRLGKRVERPVDGWENEFGPCPHPIPDSRWHDRVAVERAVQGEKIGRALTPLERRIADRIKREREEVQ